MKPYLVYSILSLMLLAIACVARPASLGVAFYAQVYAEDDYK